MDKDKQSAIERWKASIKHSRRHIEFCQDQIKNAEESQTYYMKSLEREKQEIEHTKKHVKKLYGIDLK